MNTKLDRNILKGAIASNFLFVFVVQPSLNFGVSFKITVKLENKRFVPKINHRRRQPPSLLKHTYMYIQTTKTNFTFDKNDRLQPPQHRHHWYCHHFSHSLFRLCFAPFFISLRLKSSDETKIKMRIGCSRLLVDNHISLQFHTNHFCFHKCEISSEFLTDFFTNKNYVNTDIGVWG